MDEYELNFPESGDAEIETLKHPLDANVKWKDKRSDELDFRMSAKPEAKGQKVETKKRMLSKAKGLESNPEVNKEHDKNKAKSPPKWMGHCDNESGLEGSRRGDEISNITKLKSDITGHLNELQKAATCNQDPVAKVNKSQLNTKKGSKSTSCEEREGPKSNKEVEQAGSVTLKHMSHDEDTQSNHFYDLYEGLGAEEEKVDTNKSASTQKGAGSEIILHLLRRSASGLSVIHNVNRRFLSWRASAFPKTQRNKGAGGQNGKNNKRRHKNACPAGVCHEALQHRVDENQVSAHNKMGRESEWSTDAEHAYDEMTEFEQQPSKEYLNGINSNADADLYDDLDAEENSHAMESVVHKPIPKICDSKYKNIGNKLPNSVDKLKDRKSSKSPSAKTNCRESSHEALHDGIPDRGGGDGEIYMNEEIFKNLADPGRNDSPPPIPPKMCQITQTHNNGEKNSKKTHATAIPNELRGGIFTSFTRQFSHTRTALPTKKQNTRGKQVTRVLGLCAMKPGRGKKPARLKEAKTPQMNAETHAAEVFNGKIGTDVPNGGEDEYEEYCYASELVDQPELDQQVHLDKLLCNKGGLRYE
ncbi:hypothetical protein EGR_05006 [Echinococcus granulosus]|uniref:Uncharacterized protein n=1 Tax=Echinococcus granulosus TaxID=6210 RepID=W6UGQ6_ECHGR|nr:hypothetical protein EGR_05006 [Echinococcus granulosus]EUB60153.1 hypothetical protein EGR_05006 [Echinococcus granulosus]